MLVLLAIYKKVIKLNKGTSVNVRKNWSVTKIVNLHLALNLDISTFFYFLFYFNIYIYKAG